MTPPSLDPEEAALYPEGAQRKYPLPDQEEERLEALDAYQILDTESEEAFDRITGLTRTVLDTPIAAISFVDHDRQWHKSCLGLDIKELPREESFCTYTIMDEDVMVVPNATEDPRFEDHPAVQGEMNLRFYAGAPLVTEDGYRLGSLCVIDNEPRELDQEQRQILSDLAADVVSQLQLRRSRNRLQRSTERLEKRNDRLKRLEANLREERELLFSILENAGQGMAVVNEDGTYEIVNVKLSNMYDVSTHMLHDSTDDELLPPQAAQTLKQYRQQVRTEDQELTGEFRLDLGHGERVLEYRFASIHDEQGRVRAVVQVLNDITRQREAMEDLQEAYDELESTQKDLAQAEKLAAVGEMSAGIMHEINNPNAFIQGNLEFIQKTLERLLDEVQLDELPDDLEPLVDEIDGAIGDARDGAERIETVVSNVKTFTRNEVRDGQRQPVEPAPAFREAIASFDPPPGVSLTSEVNLQPEAERSLLAGALDQVVHNLIENALDEVDPSDGEVHACLQEDPDDSDCLLLVVEDNGSGMAEDQQRKIFDPFFSTKSVGEGTGLGLSIVDGLVRSHEGSINVKSEPGEGTRFEVRLPA